MSGKDFVNALQIYWQVLGRCGLGAERLEITKAIPQYLDRCGTDENRSLRHP